MRALGPILLVIGMLGSTSIANAQSTGSAASGGLYWGNAESVALSAGYGLAFTSQDSPTLVLANATLGLGGAGGGLSLSKCMGRHGECALSASIEGRVLRTYFVSEWRHGAYAGPELSLRFIVFRIGVGQLFSLSDTSRSETAVRLGLSFESPL
jgi:hypothetical protein